MINVNKNVLNLSVAYYGQDSQLNVAIEEMSELTKEICKYKRGSKNRDHIVEETADVIIMIGNLRQIFNMTDEEINHVISSKQARLKERMENGK